MAFNMVGLPTGESCEGHIDHGYSAPWVGVEAPDEPAERFIDQDKIFQKFADEYKLSLEEIKRGENNEAYFKALSEAAKNGETPEFEQWRQKNQELMKKASELLDEFYKDRKVPENLKLEISEGAEGAFRIHNGGEDYTPMTDEKFEKLTNEQKKELSQRLERYQEEMKEFARFLKRKYFEENLSHNPELKQEKIHEGEFTPEVLERIERAKIEIGDKINLILTKGGLKPASEILLAIKTWHEDGLTEHMSEEDVQEVLSVIRALGLPHRLGERKIIEEPYSTEDEPDRQKFFRRDQMNVLVGRTSQDLEYLERALQSKSDEMLGKAFGFPPTSVEAFVGKREVLDRQSLPTDVQHSDGILFSSPTLSRDNWQQEIKQGQLYGDFIKKISPKLYEEMRVKALELLENPKN